MNEKEHNKHIGKERNAILTKKDLEISYFVGSGPGGQNKQKNNTGVQLVHKESGAIGRCSEYRSLEQNKKSAFLKLCESAKFKVWLSKSIFEIREGETFENKINHHIDEQMQDKNLKIEIKSQDGRWIESR